MSKNEFVCDCNVIHGDLVDDTLNKMKDDEYIYISLQNFLRF